MYDAVCKGIAQLAGVLSAMRVITNQLLQTAVAADDDERVSAAAWLLAADHLRPRRCRQLLHAASSCCTHCSKFHCREVDASVVRPIKLARPLFQLCGTAGGQCPFPHVPPHMCYHAEFGRSTPKAARITRKVLPKLGRTEAPLLVSDARLYPSPRGWITVTNLIAAGH